MNNKMSILQHPASILQILWIYLLICILNISVLARDELITEGAPFEFSLNGLHFTIDKKTGSILRVYSSEIGTVLETPPDSASIIDLAYPIQKFEPLRLASRYTKNAKIEVSDKEVTISWEKLGASRNFHFPGYVAASIQFKAASDNKSVILKAIINNQSQQTIPQVMFPDLMGLLPFAGEDKTQFRTAAFTVAPFEILKPSIETVPFYATGLLHHGNGWAEYKSGKYRSFSEKLVDWLDFGDVNRGFSLFARRWEPEDPHVSLMLHRSEISGKIRLLFAHSIKIAPGEEWHSDEYWLTSHQHGWAEGIEPFRAWVKKNWSRKYPLPQHIKRGMGFRTIWMANGIEDDSLDAIYRYKDLPRLAKESKEHGLNEMAIWFWCPYLQLPIKTLDYLGTEQELIDAVAECKQLGVNISLFVSVLYLADPSASRYGLTPKKEASWTYHPELIPEFNPSYASWNWSVLANQNDPKWQGDVFASFKKFIDLGLTSFVWDVFSASSTKPNIYDLAAKIRDTAFAHDPQAVFAGEGGCDIGQDYKYLDYMWNWNWNWPTYKDFRAFTSIFSAPRLNVNIDNSAKVVKYCFADNAYMNIMPSPPDGINASDLIVNHPPVSQALQQCAKLRQQFLSYFDNGELIGNCILTKECDSTHVSAYVLPDKVLMILVNSGNERSLKFSCNPDYWLTSITGKYNVKIYNSDGDLVGTEEIEQGEWLATTPELKHLDIALYEFFAK